MYVRRYSIYGEPGYNTHTYQKVESTSEEEDSKQFELISGVVVELTYISSYEDLEVDSSTWVIHPLVGYVMQMNFRMDVP